MSEANPSGRRDPRFPLRRNSEVYLELLDGDNRPSGKRYRLLDVSVAGLAFVAEVPTETLYPGGELLPILVNVGECQLRGSCLVVHSTTDESGDTVCGALFYPSGEGDMYKLHGVVAGIQAAKRR